MMNGEKVAYGHKKYVKTANVGSEGGCHECCFKAQQSNGEVICDAPCDCRFWSCWGGSDTHWKRV